MKNAIINWPNFYLLNALLYLCIGSILNNISILTLGTHGLFLLLTLYFLFLSFKECRFNKAMQSLALLFGVIMAYGIYLAVVGTDSTWKFDVGSTYFLRKHFNSIAPIFVFYYFSEKKLISEKWFRYITPIFLIAVYKQHLDIREILSLRYDAEIGEFTDNTGYFFLSLLPIAAFFRNNKKIEFSIIVFLTIMIISSMKRGTILCAVVIDFILIFDSLRNNKVRIKNILLIIIAISIVSLFVNYLYNNSDLFVLRYENTLEGGTSNREDIINRMWIFFLNQQDILRVFCGNGAHGTAHYVGYLAHNDWLEILIDMGIVGVFLYLFYWISQVKTCLMARKYGISNSIFYVLVSLMVCNFLKTLFSMSIDDMLLYSSSMMGFCLSQCNQWNISKNI